MDPVICSDRLESPNYERARGLQRVWVQVLIWWHEWGVHNDNNLLSRYKRDVKEVEFCTETLKRRAVRIAAINRLRIRL